MKTYIAQRNVYRTDGTQVTSNANGAYILVDKDGNLVEPTVFAVYETAKIAASKIAAIVSNVSWIQKKYGVTIKTVPCYAAEFVHQSISSDLATGETVSGVATSMLKEHRAYAVEIIVYPVLIAEDTECGWVVNNEGGVKYTARLLDRKLILKKAKA